MNHIMSCKNNYNLIYFWMSLKMDDMIALFIFIFIQIDIIHKLWLYMQLQITL
jgi:hypothetical protein